MRLYDYLRSKGLSQVAFGKLLGVQSQTVNRYCRGKRIPGPEDLVAIARITKGAVTVEDFVRTRRRAEARKEKGQKA